MEQFIKFRVSDDALFNHLVSLGYPAIRPGVLSTLPTEELRADINTFYVTRAVSGGYVKRSHKNRTGERTIHTLDQLKDALLKG